MPATATSDRVRLGRVRALALLVRLAESNPFDYRVMPACVAISTIFMKTWVAPVPIALAATAVDFATLTALLLALHAVYSRVQGRVAARIAPAGALLAFACVSATSAALSTSVLAVPSMQYVLMLAFTEFGLLVTIAVLRVLPSERKRVLSELEQAVEQVARMTTRLAQLVWIEQNRLARLVHGDIQSRILAAVLQAGITAPDDERGQLRQLQRDCEAALTAPVQQMTFSGFVAQLRQVWSASVQIDCQISPAVQAILDGDSVANDALCEIVREAVNNAVKHARASEVRVRLRLAAASEDAGTEALPTLCLEVRNNRPHRMGLAPEMLATEAKNGDAARRSGFRTVDQLTTAWRFVHEQDESVLLAEIPMQASLTSAR